MRGDHQVLTGDGSWSWLARASRSGLGICNGFQVLCEAHLLPGALVRNSHLHFRCADQPLVIENTTTAWTSGYEADAQVVIPVKNGEGCL